MKDLFNQEEDNFKEECYNLASILDIGVDDLFFTPYSEEFKTFRISGKMLNKALMSSNSEFMYLVPSSFSSKEGELIISSATNILSIYKVRTSFVESLPTKTLKYKSSPIRDLKISDTTCVYPIMEKDLDDITEIQLTDYDKLCIELRIPETSNEKINALIEKSNKLAYDRIASLFGKGR